MTKEQFEREKTYQVVTAIIRHMCKEELITPEEKTEFYRIMLQKYNPLLGTLYADTP